jgi:DNA-directed RNA polymerase subunit beta'
MKIIDLKTSIALSSANIPYGANLYFKHGDQVKVKDLIADWDPFNALILSDVPGKVEYRDIIEGVTYRVETDEQTDTHDKVIVESRLKTKKSKYFKLSIMTKFDKEF